MEAPPPSPRYAICRATGLDELARPAWRTCAPRFCPQPPCRSIARAIGCIVFVQRIARGREIREVVMVDGWENGAYATTAKCE